MPDGLRSLFADVDAVTFDAGYTLVHPVRSVPEVYWDAARTLGVELDRVEFECRMRSCWPRLNTDYRSGRNDLRSSEELERAAWRDFTRDVAAPYPALTACHSEWLTALVKYFDCPTAWRAAESAVDVLAELRRRGQRIGVVTNWHSAVHGILDAHGLATHCHAIITSAEAGRKKPHPEIFQAALKRLDITANRAIHIGDSLEDDIHGAQACGIRAIRLSSGHPKEADGEINAAVIHSLAELIRS